MDADSGYVEVNGIRLFLHRFCDELAAPTGLSVLLLHGYLDAGGTWSDVAGALARAGHDVIAPDLRGYGASDSVPPGAYYHFPDYVADVAALIDRLAPSRLALVGHSMGGTIAALVAGALPGQVERLVLVEGIGPPAPPGPEAAVQRMRQWLADLRTSPRPARRLSSLDDAVERLRRFHPNVPQPVLDRIAVQLTRRGEGNALFWAYDPLHRTTSPIPFHAEAFKAFLAQITCPTLYISGGPGGFHPAGEAARLACLRNLEQVEIPGAGHMMHWTMPEALAARLVQFFG